MYEVTIVNKFYFKFAHACLNQNKNRKPCNFSDTNANNTIQI